MRTFGTDPVLTKVRITLGIGYAFSALRVVRFYICPKAATGTSSCSCLPRYMACWHELKLQQHILRYIIVCYRKRVRGLYFTSLLYLDFKYAYSLENNRHKYSDLVLMTDKAVLHRFTQSQSHDVKCLTSPIYPAEIEFSNLVSICLFQLISAHFIHLEKIKLGPWVSDDALCCLTNQIEPGNL